VRHSVSLVRTQAGHQPAHAASPQWGRPHAPNPMPPGRPAPLVPLAPAHYCTASRISDRTQRFPDTDHSRVPKTRESAHSGTLHPRVIPQAGRATEMSRRTARVSLCPSQPSRPNKLHKVHAPQCCLGCCSGRPAFSLFPQPAPFTPQRSPLFLRPEHIHLPSVASRRRLSKSSRSGRCSVFCSLRSLAESYAT